MKGGVPTNLRVGDAKYIDKDGDGVLEPTLYKEGDPNSGDIVYKGTNNQRYLYGMKFRIRLERYRCQCVSARCR